MHRVYKRKMPKLQSSKLQSIGFKLFLSLTLTALGAVVVLAIMFWFSLGTGFSEYLARLELTRLHTIEAYLVRRYQQHNASWDFVRTPRDIAPPLAGNRRSQTTNTTPMRDDPENHPLKRERANKLATDARELLPQDRNTSAALQARPSPENADAFAISHRLALFDAQGKFMMGRAAAKSAPRRAIKAENGEIIGFLALAPERIKRNDIEQQFIVNQWRNMIIGCLFAISISALAAIALARYFRRPILALAKAAQDLAQGNFTTRVKLTHRDELGALAEDFNDMAQKLDNFAQSRKQWVADTSHELRTPLTILRAHTEAMRDGIMPLNQQGLANIDSAVKDLERLVADLYQLARADIGLHEYAWENILLPELFNELNEKFTTPFRQLGLTLKILPLPSLNLHGDEGRLTQLFSNLINNSMGYTHAGGGLTISAIQTHSFVEITLDDTAPGVPDTDLPHLFERFYRVDVAHQRNTGGSGLGLSICQAIVKSHGGKIIARHSPLGGLQIKLYLPLAKE